ncbi:N-acetylmuramoyl-L-alanine amidase [Clostridium estertheticum]|uniref:N-acetylmuramoyl-L-alanine amidase n=1 Tax=Clostridium estertheticum TaxID=238834 RepID=UPI001CF4C2CE|nr:N-acetylmuramoyl-L-alanine amidase [Clostridium estertheticum]MCB2354327.1 N-acetylmuramoyl-L-alanine amidase [Clostridium estertheticum]WAG42554.1 N-acetylmuramoyl-L-alanine amidase [Clostridium estertheticum]
MSKFLLDMGHCLKGFDTGTQGYGKREEICTREVGYKVKSKLEALGHTVIIVSCDSANSVIESLAYRVDTANRIGGDLYIAIHLNSGGGFGTEIYTYNAKIFTEASNILKNFVGLGLTDRGIKDGSHLYVIHNTDMKSLLVECCFMDSKSDMDVYNSDKMSDAIVLGITGQKVTPTVVSPTIKFRKILKVIKQTACISENGSLVKTFKTGDMLTAIDEDKNWWILLIGSVSKANTIEIKVQYGKISASNLFVRQEPHITATKLGSLNKDTRVQVNKIDGDWVNIVYNGGFGWVFGKYVTLV